MAAKVAARPQFAATKLEVSRDRSVLCRFGHGFLHGHAGPMGMRNEVEHSGMRGDDASVAQNQLYLISCPFFQKNQLYLILS